MKLKELFETAAALELKDLEDWYFNEKDTNLRERRDIPNVDGFKFIAVTHDGEKIKSKVIRRPNGTHGVRGAKFSEIKGWLPLSKE